ncbi:hypothetical protein B0J11DRAFT_591913 [Dendryphion nanum]|uniref:Uncharacterized protein n=1 Tax=Dendryphion nanum TaxID=256645 RepID=A0A9P9IEA5_9PLEO|nr:hypothetical protein B0J11DRAFT_591913 [Dendryphion nanum]
MVRIFALAIKSALAIVRGIQLSSFLSLFAVRTPIITTGTITEAEIVPVVGLLKTGDLNRQGKLRIQIPALFRAPIAGYVFAVMVGNDGMRPVDIFPLLPVVAAGDRFESSLSPDREGAGAFTLGGAPWAGECAGNDRDKSSEKVVGEKHWIVAGSKIGGLEIRKTDTRFTGLQI